jgi:hypothetical protein
MAQGSSKSVRAKAQRQAGATGFTSRLAGASSSEDSDADSDWLDDKSEGGEEDMEEACVEMERIYSFFLPRHLQLKTAAYHDEKKVCMNNS